MAENENNRIQMDFLEVCSFGDLKQAKAMLKSGKIDLRFRHHGNGWTALHWATRRNHQEIVELLLQAGFDAKSPAKDGKTPLDLVTSEAVKEILKQPVNIKASQEDSHADPVNHEIYSIEKLDSLHHSRFLLVRTSIENEKECFKRVSLSGCGSIDVLKLIIERAMKKGKVLEVITLPDKVKIKTEEQIRNLENHQKVEVVFSSAVMNKETSCSEKLSPDEDKITHSKYAPTLEKKFISVINEYLNEPESYGESIDNIISVNDTSNCTNVDDSFSRMKGSDSFPKEQLMNTEVAVTSEFSLTAQSSSSITNIIVPPKILVKEMIKLQAIRESETKEDYKLAGFESKVETDSVILSLSPEVDVNASTVYYTAKSNCFAAVREEWDEVIVKDISYKRTLQIALLVGCIVGFGGLTYMLYKK